MKNNYPLLSLQFIAVLVIAFAFSSCKKSSTPKPVVDATPVTLGLFEYASDASKRIFIPISAVGTKTVNYDLIFDSGSTGLTIDANGIIPDSLITPSGFNFTGDSLVTKNGITITSHKSTMAYGNAISSTTEYGNLAYASITIPNEGSSGVTIKRVAMFLYYKIVDQNNKALAHHSGDIFGVGPGVSYTNSSIASPLSYYSPGTGLTNGFKLATLNSGDFTTSPVYVGSLLTLGLTQADLTSSGFIMHPLSISNPGGYSPDIPGTITYNGNTISAQLLFDTGTPQLSIIEDKAASSLGQLPAQTVVTVATNKGFTYTYTTTNTANLTEVENPKNTQDFRSIFSIDFFIDNEFLTDYTNHQIGLKNN